MDPSSRIFRFCVVVFTVLRVVIADSTWSYDAIFSFGDSNSDTGGYSALFPPQYSPYGITFFHKPVGRNSDGRLIIDFLAEGLGLPFLSPYVRSVGSDYKYGANFASTSASTLDPKFFSFGTRKSTLSPFYLQIQLNQMKLFKHDVEHSIGLSFLPKADIFGKSLYTLHIGQNDFFVAFVTAGIDGTREFIPKMINQIISFIEELYGLGGREFMVFDLAPYGCYPAFLVRLPNPKESDFDEFGCMKSINNVVLEYNNMLKEALNQTRQQFSDVRIIHVDIHTLSLQLFQDPTSYGFKYTTKACCGFGGGKYNFVKYLTCGDTKVIDGQNVKAEACSDVHNYVSWDGYHFTDAANKWMASAILNDSYIVSHFPLHNVS